MCWGPGQPATTLALVDEGGLLVDILHVGSFSGPARRPYSRDQPYKVLEDPSKVGVVSIRNQKCCVCLAACMRIPWCCDQCKGARRPARV